jgi:hypothetical protein
MARKSTVKAKPVESAERLSVLNLKGSPEYKNWLALISKQSLIPTTVIVRDALAKWSRDRGYPEPPEV